jgi:hypothetical protein
MDPFSSPSNSQKPAPLSKSFPVPFDADGADEPFHLFGPAGLGPWTKHSSPERVQSPSLIAKRPSVTPIKKPLARPLFSSSVRPLEVAIFFSSSLIFQPFLVHFFFLFIIPKKFRPFFFFSPKSPPPCAPRSNPHRLLNPHPAAHSTFYSLQHPINVQSLSIYPSRIQNPPHNFAHFQPHPNALTLPQSPLLLPLPIQMYPPIDANVAESPFQTSHPPSQPCPRPFPLLMSPVIRIAPCSTMTTMKMSTHKPNLEIEAELFPFPRKNRQNDADSATNPKNALKFPLLPDPSSQMNLEKRKSEKIQAQLAKKANGCQNPAWNRPLAGGIFSGRSKALWWMKKIMWSFVWAKLWMFIG